MAEPTRLEAIEALETALRSRVVVVAASWRPDTRHDLGVDAARAFVEVFESFDERPEHLTLFVVARGGHAAFADQVLRTLRGSGTTFDVLVPTFCNGVATILALGADGVAMHSHAGLGAYDCGPLQAEVGRLDHDLIDFVPALGGIHYQTTDSHLPARLASGVRHRQLCRELAHRVTDREDALAALANVRLGNATGLGADELRALGLQVEAAAAPQVWATYRAVEDELELRAAARRAYTESDLADEVEFEPAVGLTAALIGSTERSVSFVLDTGQVDPDTGNYVGSWTW